MRSGKRARLTATELRNLDISLKFSFNSFAVYFYVNMSTEGKVIRCRAAVAWGPKKPLTVETIEVAPPKAGEVRIRIVATSICHTDAYSLSGDDLEALFPAVMGHEGAGIVESVGEGVSSVKPGDHVIPVFIPQCRKCDFCKSPKTNLCQAILDTQVKGVLPEGTSRFSLNGQPLYHYMGCSTFSEYTVCAEISVAKIDPKADLDVVCVLGCGVSTGYGGALVTAKVEPGTTCAVWGLGAVGLAVALGCQHAGARQIVGIDTNPEKFEVAKKFGCTEFINPKDLNEPIEEYVKKNFNGGFDYTFPCVGSVKVMNDAFECSHKGWGTSVIVGVAPSCDRVSTRPFNLLTGRTWKGTGFGGWKSLDDIPLLAKKFIDGKLDLDLFITHHFSIDQINEAFETLLSGKGLRSILKYQ